MIPTTSSTSTIPLSLAEEMQVMKDQLTGFMRNFDSFVLTTDHSLAHLMEQAAAQSLLLKSMKEQMANLGTHRVTLLHPTASANPEPPRVVLPMQEGLEAYTKGNYPLSLANFTQAIESGKLADAEMAHALYSRGKAYASMELWDFAMNDYDNCILKAPSNPITWLECLLHRGIAYESKGEMKKAHADYDKAVQRCTEAETEERLTLRSKLHLLRGCAWANLDEISKAVADFNCVDSARIERDEETYFQPILQTKIYLAKSILREQRNQEKAATESKSSSSTSLKKPSPLESSPPNKRRRLSHNKEETRDNPDHSPFTSPEVP